MPKTTERAFELSLSGQRAPVAYERAPTYPGMIAEKDVMVPSITAATSRSQAKGDSTPA